MAIAYPFSGLLKARSERASDKNPSVLTSLSPENLTTLFRELQVVWSRTLHCKPPNPRHRLSVWCRVGTELRSLRAELRAPPRSADTVLGRLDPLEYVQLANIIGLHFRSVFPKFNQRSWGEAAGIVRMKYE